jgi:ubiquinone/menaquinone biosynthesis C-methylase UbiE
VLLNRLEYAMMNNPVRAAVQRHFEARRLLDLGGGLNGGAALEIGCGRGVGVEIILDIFGAGSVAAFALDPSMVALARKRLRSRAQRIRLWTGDAAAIAAHNATYDAVFDFGIVHHVPDWRRALAEVHRVLKPGGRFYAEEVLRSLVTNPIVRRLLHHPQADRFDRAGFLTGMEAVGLTPLGSRGIGSGFAWFVAEKNAAA